MVQLPFLIDGAYRWLQIRLARPELSDREEFLTYVCTYSMSCGLGWMCLCRHGCVVVV